MAIGVFGDEFDECLLLAGGHVGCRDADRFELFDAAVFGGENIVRCFFREDEFLVGFF